MPWNSPLLLMTLEAGPGAGRGLHGGDQAVRARARLHAGLRRAGRGGRVPAGRGQRRHRLGPGRSARPWPGTREWTRWRSPGRPATGRAVAHAAADEPQPGTSGAGRQVRAGGVPRRRPGRGGQRRVAGVFAATGQTCMAGSRLIVHADVHDELVRLVVRARRRDDQGRRPGYDPDTEMGPLANRPQYEKVLRLSPDRGRARARRWPAAARPTTEPGRVFRPAHRADRGQPGDRPWSARRCSGRCCP